MKRLISKLSVFAYLPLVAFFTMPIAAWAQSSTPTIRNIQVLQGFNDIFQLLSALSDFLFDLAPILATIIIAWGGYQYFLSGLDESKKNGLNTVRAGIIGLSITLGARLITGIVQDVFEDSADSNQINANPLIEFITNLWTGVLIPLSTSVAVLVIIWGGYKYFFAGFDESKKDGLNTVKNGVIGLIIVSIAQLITNLVAAAFPNPETGEGGNLADVPGQLGTLLNDVVGSSSEALSTLASAACILVIIWGGYKYFQGGFDGKAEGIKNIQRGVIGLVVILLANFITSTVTAVFGGIEEDGSNLADLPEQFRTIVEPIITSGTNVLFGLAGLISVLVIMYGGYQFFFAAIPSSKANGRETITRGIIGLVVTIVSSPLVTIIITTIRASEPQDEQSYLQFNNGSIIYTIQALITNLLIPVSSLFAVFFMILGGYYWFTSNGDQEKIKRARTQITNSLIAFVVILLSVTIVQMIIFFVRTDDFVQVDDTPSLQQNGDNTITIPNSGGGNSPSNDDDFTVPQI